MGNINLLSTENIVQSPFIMATINNYTFGLVSKKKVANLYSVHYPNFIQSLTVKKVNGLVNNYDLNMTYALTRNSDPNMVDKILSGASLDRKMILTYGDWMSPSFIYKDEETLISSVNTNVDFAGNKITYSIKSVSNSLKLKSLFFNFPATTAKPSDLILGYLNYYKYGLKDIFTGMRNLNAIQIKELLLQDDKRVKIEAQVNMNIIDYINYLVSCMECLSDPDTRYYLKIEDNPSNTEYGGTYFKICKIKKNISATDTYSTYEVNINYSDANSNSSLVKSFSVDNNDSWAILYNYAQKETQLNYNYRIDNEGKINATYAPSLIKNPNLLIPTSDYGIWWRSMTEFPIKATLTIQGLLRPSVLMSHVRINAYFFGNKHTSSGLYLITGQQDSISGNGYYTTLSLLRESGDFPWESKQNNIISTPAIEEEKKTLEAKSNTNQNISTYDKNWRGRPNSNKTVTKSTTKRGKR